MNKLLACVDASTYAVSVADHAAWAAERLGMAIELLHVIQRPDSVAARHDLSGAVGFGAKSNLLEELAAIDEAQGRLAQEAGRALLEAAKARLEERGLRAVELTHRHGGIVETVVEREADADLVVIGKRGVSADFAKGHLGSKVERVVRASAKQVLVASRAFRPLGRALIGFDGGSASRKAVAFAATSPLFAGVRLHLVLAGQENDASRRHLQWAEEVLGERGRRVDLVSGDADQVLIAEAGHREADLIVMGAYGHSRIRELIVGSAASLFLGSTTSSVLRGVQLPVLLFR